LFPGLHPDGFEEADSGWPRVLRRVAAEAWRRAEAGELSDDELYCYQACKARIRRGERKWKESSRGCFATTLRHELSRISGTV